MKAGAGLPALLRRPRIQLFARLAANGAVQALCAAATAWTSQRAFDAWIMERRPAPWPPAVLATLLLGLYVVMSALRMSERVTAERLAQSYVRAVRLALFDRLGRLSPSRLQERGRGPHLLRFIGDLAALRQWLSLGLARLAVAGLSLPVLLAALAFIAPFVAALLVPVMMLGVVAALALAPRMRAAVRETRRRRARLTTFADESIASVATMQAFGRLKVERRRLAHRSQRLASAMVMRARMIGALRAAADATKGVATVTVLAGGAFVVHAGRATPGTMVAAMAVLGLYLPLLRDLARAHQYWQGYAVSRQNLGRFLTPAEADGSLVRGARTLRCERGEIVVEGLEVAASLAGVTATARAGQRVAILGGDGAGKSTLLGVIARLLDADAGRVLIDGVDLRECRLASVRAAVALVAPELPLMRGTLEHNLRYRCPDAPREELERVMRMTGVEELARRSREGLARRVAAGGANLSASERQRVMLARVLLGAPRILLLDVTPLGPVNSAIFSRIVDSFEGTVLMVTHELATAQRCDWVWHLERGALVAQGEAARLLRPGERSYAALSASTLRAVA